MFDDYLNDVFDSARKTPTEGTYYPHLKKMLEAVAPTFGKKNVKAELLPQRNEGGCPDIVVWDGENHIVGYIEAKDLGMDISPGALSKANKKQFDRYLKTFPNLIYTNFIEFRLYKDHDPKPVIQVVLSEHPDDLGFKIRTDATATEALKGLLEKFFSFSLPKKFTAKSLARELARRTRFLRDEVDYEMKLEEGIGEEQLPKGKRVGRFYEAFRNALIKQLTETEFCDLFAQTITFGLIAARYRATDDFTRENAYAKIPPTIGVLRELFSHISTGQLPRLINQVINDIADVLSVVDVHQILDKYYKEGAGKDPIFDFYETFLEAYNPKEKEQRGVYYTPKPVVRYIVRSVHKLLQRDPFNREEGLGCYSTNDSGLDVGDSVVVLDPAGGTLTFFAEATLVAWEGQVEVHGDGEKEGFIKQHVLKNFYAFEFMMAPYVLGHLKMSFLLEKMDHVLAGEERFRFYLIADPVVLDTD